MSKNDQCACLRDLPLARTRLCWHSYSMQLYEWCHLLNNDSRFAPITFQVLRLSIEKNTTLDHYVSNPIKKKRCMSMSTQCIRDIWTVGFAETKRLWDTNVRACNILYFSNWHWLTTLGMEITLSGALRIKLFFFVWRRCLDCDVVSRNVEYNISIFHRSDSQSKSMW